jgi:hypothetical protein
VSSPQVVIDVRNAETGDDWKLCDPPGTLLGDDDYIMLLGGEPFTATQGTAPEIAAGVNFVCNNPMTRDMVLSYQSLVGSTHLRVWFYGVPD